MIILNSKPASSQSNNHSHQKDGENILWMSEADKSCSQIHTHAPLTGRLENWQCFLPLLASQHITQRKLQGINFNYFFFQSSLKYSVIIPVSSLCPCLWSLETTGIVDLGCHCPHPSEEGKYSSSGTFT